MVCSLRLVFSLLFVRICFFSSLSSVFLSHGSVGVTLSVTFPAAYPEHDPPLITVHRTMGLEVLKVWRKEREWEARM